MVVGIYRTANETVTRNPRTVEEFEEMMKESVRIGKTYVSPFVKKKPVDNNIVTYDPNLSPFAPLYRPGREVLISKDKLHPLNPPRYLGEKEQPKQLLVAAGAGGVPPEGGSGNDPFKNDMSKLAKFAEAKKDLINNASKDLYSNKNTKL
ncbi:MAG: hypothetical protein K6E29_07445 [Cyanobacteria bacterium RUI128]|nr:hypothetical protein [Cyanobacteria bacterium RUI128]